MHCITRIVKQLTVVYLRLHHLVKYPDENNHDHLLAEIYGRGGAEDIYDYAAI